MKKNIIWILDFSTSTKKLARDVIISLFLVGIKNYGSGWVNRKHASLPQRGKVRSVSGFALLFGVRHYHKKIWMLSRRDISLPNGKT
jgi:hypothetical protein